MGTACSKPCGPRLGGFYFLTEHLERLAASARAFRLPFPANVPWQERLAQLLAANGLSRGPARVKILLTRGVAAGLGLPEECRPTLVIYAQPYTPPSPEAYAAGWPVVVFPEGRSTFVGRHKSLNYLFYLAARQFALDQGAKEALILEADGLVSEGAATSLIYLHQGHYYLPASASALPGVTVTVLGRGLAARGLSLESPSHHRGPASGGRRPLAGQLPHGADAGGRSRRDAGAAKRRHRLPARGFGGYELREARELFREYQLRQKIPRF